MNKKRSLSLDETYMYSEGDESLSIFTSQEKTNFEQLKTEIAETIRIKRTQQKREGYAYVLSNSWFSVCCGIFSPSWEKNYLELSQDSLVITKTPEGSNGVKFNLKHAEMKLSDLPGHKNSYYCLTLTNPKQELQVSFENSEDFGAWQYSISKAIDTTSNYFYM